MTAWRVRPAPAACAAGWRGRRRWSSALWVIVADRRRQPAARRRARRGRRTACCGPAPRRPRRPCRRRGRRRAGQRHPGRPGAGHRHLDLRRRRRPPWSGRPGSTAALDARAAALAGRAAAADTGIAEPDPAAGAAGPRRRAAGGHRGHEHVAGALPAGAAAGLDRSRRRWPLRLLVVVHLVLRANVARALRPVQQMSAQAGRWSADDVDRRFGPRAAAGRAGRPRGHPGRGAGPAGGGAAAGAAALRRAEPRAAHAAGADPGGGGLADRPPARRRDGRPTRWPPSATRPPGWARSWRRS